MASRPQIEARSGRARKSWERAVPSSVPPVNIQHPTSNIQHPMGAPARVCSDKGSWERSGAEGSVACRGKLELPGPRAFPSWSLGTRDGNIQHPTSNTQHPMGAPARVCSDKGSWERGGADGSVACRGKLELPGPRAFPSWSLGTRDEGARDEGARGKRSEGGDRRGCVPWAVARESKGTHTRALCPAGMPDLTVERRTRAKRCWRKSSAKRSPKSSHKSGRQNSLP